MRDTAQRIAGGDLSARVDLTEGPDDELRSLAHSLDAMANGLETARGHERTFLLSVSHELRTPLTSIRGYADAITDGIVEDPAERARAGSIIAAEARRLERLVADLLDLARLDARQFSLQPGSPSTLPRRRLRRRRRAFVPSARDWGLRLEVVRGDPAPADVDPERLRPRSPPTWSRRTPSSTPAARCRVGGDRRDGQVEVRVDDDGPGIPAADRDRVFERLYTTQEHTGPQGRDGDRPGDRPRARRRWAATPACQPLDPQAAPLHRHHPRLTPTRGRDASRGGPPRDTRWCPPPATAR